MGGIGKNLDLKDEDELGTHPGESGAEGTACTKALWQQRQKEEKGLKGGPWGWAGSKV